jgi:tetratricopeptide (TPR) repeat protein
LHLPRTKFLRTSNWPSLLRLGLFFLSLIIGSGIAQASPSVSKKMLALKEKANYFYRLKKYSQACPIYRAIIDLDSLNAKAHIDLGLCLQNLGKKDSALWASREALKISGRSLVRFSDSDQFNPDLRARKSAYFNLDKLGGPMPEPDSGHCETWANFGICSKAFYACVDVGRLKTEKGTERWSVLRIGIRKDQAIFSMEDAETVADLPRPEIRDMEEMNIYGDFHNRGSWLNRDSVVQIPLGESVELNAGDDLGSSNPKEKLISECRVLHFNPCTGLVGMACAIEQAKGKDQIVITEYYLIPAQ